MYLANKILCGPRGQLNSSPFPMCLPNPLLGSLEVWSAMGNHLVVERVALCTVLLSLRVMNTVCIRASYLRSGVFKFWPRSFRLFPVGESHSARLLVRSSLGGLLS